MKTNAISFLLFLHFFTVSTNSSIGQVEPTIIEPQYSTKNIPERAPNAGGEIKFEKTECISKSDRIEISKILEQNIQALKEQGLLADISERSVMSFGWPLKKISSLDYNSYYMVSNYFDQNTSSGLLDYNCGQRTYNGHQGTDVATWPFPWFLVNTNAVEVIAAETGTIIGKFDGNSHNNCSCSGTWNAVYVQHSDGSVAWYGHLKLGSLTTKSIGQTIVKGEYLGIVASSGCSTGPHLHFEVYEALPYQTSNLIDPYLGTCNTTNSQSWWATQKPYWEATLNANLTHSAEPVHGCPTANEIPHFSNAFVAGANAYFATYYHDQQIGHVTTHRIRRPDNSIWQTWTATSPNTYPASWWYWIYTLPSIGPNGTWKWEVVYQGETFTHNFTVSGGLPVEVVRLQGSWQKDNSVKIYWQTESEKNIDHYRIERSEDGINFFEIGKTSSQSIFSESNDYTYIDAYPIIGLNYYRLAIVENDGEHKTSDIVSVSNTGNPTIRFHPNPTTGLVTIDGLQDCEATIFVRNAQGQVVIESLLQDNTLNISNLNSGLYTLQIICGGQVSVERVVKE